MLTGTERVVGGGGIGQAVGIHAIIDNVIRYAPDDHGEGLEVGELRITARIHFPKAVGDAGGGEDVGVGTVRDDGGTIGILGGGVVGIHEQDGGGGDAGEIVIGAGVIVGGDIAGGIGGADQIVIGFAGDETGQFDHVTGDERKIGDAEVEIGAVGAVTDEGGGGLGGLPGDGEDADIGGAGDGADGGRNEIGGGGGAPFAAAGVHVVGFQAVAIGNLNLAGGGGAGDGGDRAGEGAVIAQGVQQIGEALVLGEVGEEHADGVAGGAIGVKDFGLDLTGRGVGRTVEQDETGAEAE